MAEPPPYRFRSFGQLSVAAFTFAYMLVASVAAIKLKNQEFVFYLTVMGILIAIVAALHWRVGLHTGSLWGLSVWGLAHMAGGLVPVPGSWPIKGDTSVLYNLWLIPGLLKYDQLIHAYGFGLVTIIAWQGLQAAFRKRGVDVEPTIGLLVLCVSCGMGFGAANEIVEFVATLTLPSTNVGGYENTGWDLVANLVGCILAACLIRILTPKGSGRLDSP